MRRVIRHDPAQVSPRIQECLVAAGPGPQVARITLARPGYTGGQSMHRDAETEERVETGERPDHPPKVADALKSGVAVSVTSWSGRQLQGTVSDRDEAGLLLGIEDGAERREGYVFLPWFSVERVAIPRWPTAT